MLRVPSRGQTGRQGAPGDATRSAQRTAPGVGNAEPFLAGSDSRLRRRSLPPHDQDKALRQDGAWQPEMLRQIGRAHVLTPVTNAHPVCRLLLEKQKTISDNQYRT